MVSCPETKCTNINPFVEKEGFISMQCWCGRFVLSPPNDYYSHRSPTQLGPCQWLSLPVDVKQQEKWKQFVLSYPPNDSFSLPSSSDVKKLPLQHTPKKYHQRWRKNRAINSLHCLHCIEPTMIDTAHTACKHCFHCFHRSNCLHCLNSFWAKKAIMSILEVWGPSGPQLLVCGPSDAYVHDAGIHDACIHDTCIHDVCTNDTCIHGACVYDAAEILWRTNEQGDSRSWILIWK